MSELRAELTGSVWKILAEPGTEVTRGQEIMVLESMKMEIPIEAPHDGTVTDVDVAEGEAVEAGTLLARMNP
ncbi:biotin/lipoyl-binding carrier protein [Nocardioides sp. L-11A]|uniref:biotin/lipoyl-binding carrier protein n=1 Tax=Nocardioides sp. L-11A TaxID=3043848 RepID=UPI00249B3AAB|nr:biotin/lipoyl-binding carrier protein [Nocardioides sp. L-11A]